MKTLNVSIIPLFGQRQASADLAEEYGAAFEYNDFFSPALLGDGAACFRRVRDYLAMGRDTSRDTLHGAFLDVTIHSDDADIRRVSETRVRQSMACARDLGVRGVVFHTNLIPNFNLPSYVANWVSRNRDFWGRILEEFPNQEIYIENMFDLTPEPIARLAEAMGGHPRFGLCLDWAHAVVFGGGGPDPVWADRLGPWVRHMHINDNDGLADLHLAVGEGVVDWQRYDSRIRRLPTAPTVLVETSDLARQRRSLEYMERRGIYPFPAREDITC